MQTNTEINNQDQEHNFAKPPSGKKKWLVAIIFILIVGSVWVYALFGRRSSELTETTEPTQLSQQMEPVENQQELLSETEDLSDEMVEQTDLPPTDESQLAVKDALLTLEADQTSYNQGDQIELNLVLTTTNTPDGVQFVINYDQALLSQVEAQSTNTFGSYVTQRVEASEGSIKGMLLRNAQETVEVAEPLSLLRITGVAYQTGSLVFSFDEDKTQVAAAAGQDVLQNASDLTVVIE